MDSVDLAPPAPETRSRRRRRGLLLFATLSLTAFAAVQSMAVFTNTADPSTGNLFDNGSLIITTDKAATATITLQNMAPGDTQTGSIVVTNSGTLNLRYAMRTTITDDQKPQAALVTPEVACAALGGAGCLSTKLILTIKTGDVADNASCAAFDGDTLYTGSLAGAFIGSNAQGEDAGDRVLSAAALGANPEIVDSVGNETLCFVAHLPLQGGNSSTVQYPGGPADVEDTDNGFQLASTTATFTFDAEQTSNNP